MRFKFICVLFVATCTPVLAPAQSINETVIHNFILDPTGQHPSTGLIQASDGNFYGTMADTVGFGGYGSVYRVSPSGDFSIVYAFTNGLDGGQPAASLIEGPDGALYGTTTQAGGRVDAGNVFRLTLDGQFYNLFQFTGIENGIQPNTTLTLGSDGNLYGVLGYGGPNYTGAIFKLSLAGEYTNLFTFLGTNIDTVPYGQYPGSPLLEYEPGEFVGTTEAGGAAQYPGCGTIFTITSTGGFEQIHNYATNKGPDTPWYYMAVASDGNLYGTTQNGPETGQGDVFRITPELDYSDAYILTTVLDGDEPPGLFPGSDGRLYTTTYGGGTGGTGNIVAITTDGDMSILYSFGPINPNLTTPADGWNPMASPVQGSDGAFYGTASLGGTNFMGAVWRLAFSPPLPPPVQLTLSSTTVAAGEPVELSWKAVNAFSLSMQQCYAFVQNNAGGAGDWSGQQKGSMSDGAYQGSATLVPTTTGTFTYALTCGGVESGFATLNVRGNAKQASSTAFVISPNVMSFGTQTQFQVAVSGAAGIATGEVTFSADGKNLTTLTLKNGSVTATLPVRGFPAGTYKVTANYLGDAKFAPSSSAPVTATILPAQAPTRSFVYDTASSEEILGETFNVNAIVYSIPQTAVPTGTLNFYLSGKFVGTGAVVGNQIFGSNPLSTDGFPAGTYPLTAVYSGDENNAPSTAAVNTIYLAVTPDSTLVDVKPVTVTVPGSVSLTARVLNIGNNVWPTSGEVIFYANGKKFGSAAVNSDGYASLSASTKGIAPGVYLVTAEYQGNGTFGQSTSEAQTVTLK